MSVRLEYADATHIAVTYVNEKELENLGLFPDAEPEDRKVLVLGYDEAFVITGTPTQLLSLARRIEDAVFKAHL